MRTSKFPYSDKTAKTPQKLTESVGFKELAEELGLTDTLLTKALVADIKKKKGNRVREIELGYKVRGRLNNNDNGGPTTNIVNIFADDQIRRAAHRYLEVNNGSTTAPDRLPDSNQP